MEDPSRSSGWRKSRKAAGCGALPRILLILHYHAFLLLTFLPFRAIIAASENDVGYATETLASSETAAAG